MEKNNKMIVCAGCGAEYEAALVRCPYCKSAYAPAEENEYIGKLEDVRKDLAKHKEYGNISLKKGLGTTVRIAILVIAAILILVFGSIWLSNMREKSRNDKRKAEFLIEQGISPEQEETEE